MAEAGFRLDGKVAIVTGGSKGIGLAVAEALLGRGASVAISARGGQALDAVARRLEKAYPRRVLALESDVRR
jgi:3-oxoacyl-[acyl-carrier protein] reductase